MTADIGIDPGGRFTGVVLRDGELLIYAATLTRDTDDMRPYIALVMETIGIARAKTFEPRISVEGLNSPTPQMGTISVFGLLGTAQVLGAVLGVYPDAVIVPPDGNGSAPLPCYPPALVGPREKKGTGPRKHARSAWDVAGRAEMYEVFDNVIRSRENHK